EGRAVAAHQHPAVGQDVLRLAREVDDLGHVGQVVEREADHLGPPGAERPAIVAVPPDLEVEQPDLVARRRERRPDPLDPELLDGVIVAMAPRKPGHAGTIHRVARALRRAVGERADVREDKSLVLAPFSVPEPDVAVVVLDPHDYLRAHPTTALLVVEVSDSSLP